MRVKHRFILPTIFFLLFSTVGSMYRSASRYATAVLSGTKKVENAYYAVGPPDGKFAAVDYFGNLRLKLRVTDGEGDDIAIHAKTPYFPHIIPLSSYKVYVREESGEWKHLGIGHGCDGPDSPVPGGIDEFDLKKVNLKEIDEIDIRFTMNEVGVPPTVSPSCKYQLEIESVKNLHENAETEAE